MLYIDIKYLKLIQNQLPLFKQKSDTVYSCRCTICGDSKKKANKTRGNFYSKGNSLFYKCFNCDASMQFGSFLKLTDKLLYDQYVLERYAEGLSFNKPHQNAEDKFKMEEPVFKKKSLLDELLDRLDTLPEDNEAVQFCIKRKIPKEVFNRLYFIDDVRKIEQLSEKYKGKVKTSEPRLVIPFLDKSGQLLGVTCRALRNEELRYITFKIKEEDNFIFGLDKIDTNKLVYAVEGPIDSLFVKNAIAVSGTSFGKLKSIGVPKEKLVIVFDNQPRNKEVVKLFDKAIENDFKVVVWPQNILEKDINEMFLAGKNIDKLLKLNTFSGLEAKMKFIGWKRV
ncbi:MAG: DNA primase [Proteobacteria bacterium]|nr:DNA primase [Pseudomonadota bacterium]NBP15545.1 DNA primase [bacterium]